MRPLVVVSGSGRSGTSLTMQVLHACGLRVSDELTGRSPANPRGAWEDPSIFSEQARLLHALAVRALPRPADWRATPLADEIRSKLDRILRDRLSRTGSVWGFKDPKTCLFLPMWQELSAAHDCDLRFVWCVRQADDVVASLMSNYGHTIELAQSMYFIRNAFAMAESPSNTFVVHYEDLLGRDITMLRALCEFCGLAAESDDRLGTIMAEVCDDELNRAGGSLNLALATPVRQLSEKLEGLRGAVPDIDPVRQAGRELLAPLQHWDFVIEAARAAVQEAQEAKVQMTRTQGSGVREMERIKEAHAREIERLKQSSTRLKAKADQEISVLRREIKRLASEQAAAVQTGPSPKELRQQLRAEISKAFERPGLRTLKLPSKLARVYRKHRRAVRRARARRRAR